MPKFADLEIAIRRRDGDSCGIELRLSPPDSDTDERFPKEKPATAVFSMAALRELEMDPGSYGAALGRALFENSEVQAGFTTARSAASPTSISRPRTRRRSRRCTSSWPAAA